MYLQVPCRHPASSTEGQATSGVPAGCPTGGWSPLGGVSVCQQMPQPSPPGVLMQVSRQGLDIYALGNGTSHVRQEIFIPCPASCPATWCLLKSFPRPQLTLTSPIWRGALQLGEVCILAGLTDGLVPPWSVQLVRLLRAPSTPSRVLIPTCWPRSVYVHDEGEPLKPKVFWT